ncbi:hypothetical protein PENDEC_c002G03131 [Penicillium decumbens]|uniref:Uncharacterized protein n=1 Tax=Penicillium decumbens TaxID=69771 RepID=A0A1V6PLC0_PENDC|nr:hypothetical protein PENDEC_c002G03131 [Penicillium decumbens]
MAFFTRLYAIILLAIITVVAASPLSNLDAFEEFHHDSAEGPVVYGLDHLPGIAARIVGRDLVTATATQIVTEISCGPQGPHCETGGVLPVESPTDFVIPGTPTAVATDLTSTAEETSTISASVTEVTLVTITLPSTAVATESASSVAETTTISASVTEMTSATSSVLVSVTETETETEPCPSATETPATLSLPSTEITSVLVTETETETEPCPSATEVTSFSFSAGGAEVTSVTLTTTESCVPGCTESVLSPTPKSTSVASSSPESTVPSPSSESTTVPSSIPESTVPSPSSESTTMPSPTPESTTVPSPSSEYTSKVLPVPPLIPVTPTVKAGTTSVPVEASTLSTSVKATGIAVTVSCSGSNCAKEPSATTITTAAHPSGITSTTPSASPRSSVLLHTGVANRQSGFLARAIMVAVFIVVFLNAP